MKINRVLVAPDSFKGSTTAAQAADAIALGVGDVCPECEIIKLPISDGGEGSLDIILGCTGGEIYTTQVLSPDDRRISARYGITPDGTAVLELAESSGMTRQQGLHPLTSSTYGFGEMIRAALDRGARRFLLCLGGSASTDGGCGMAAALGVTFSEGLGRPFIPCGGTLAGVESIETGGLDLRVRESEFTVMADVDNPLCGVRGAARVFAPQKGAGEFEVQLLDMGLVKLATLLNGLDGTDYATLPGGGAAGGLGAGCAAFLGAKLRRGIDAVLDLCRFEELLKGTDLIITGEGRLDGESLDGKVLSGILRRCGGVQVVSVCGENAADAAKLDELGVKAFSASAGITAGESMANPAKYLRAAASRAMLWASEHGQIAR